MSEVLRGYFRCIKTNEVLLFDNNVVIQMPSTFQHLSNSQRLPPELQGFYNFNYNQAYFFIGEEQYLAIMVIEDSCNQYEKKQFGVIGSYKNIFELVYPHIQWGDRNNLPSGFKEQKFSIRFNKKSYNGLIGILYYDLHSQIYINYCERDNHLDYKQTLGNKILKNIKVKYPK